MSRGLTHFVESGNPRAVLKTPVEVWQEIIEHVLYDPIAFLTDPYYPGCNFHTAFNEWTDRRRLRKLEVQRGTLRLVSHSWRDLIDSRSWKYFEPYLCGNTIQQSTWAQSARRLDLDNVCIETKNIIGDSSSRCDECEYEQIYIPAISDVPNFNPPLFRATITRMALYDGEICSKIQYSHLDTYFPNVRALFAGYSNGRMIHVQPLSLFSRLTFLSLFVPWIVEPNPNEVAPRFPALRTFHLDLEDGKSIDFLKQWEMPLLAHFQVSIQVSHPSLTPLFSLLTRIGKGLVRLCIRIDDDYVILPDDFWKIMPMLKYFGTSLLRHDSTHPMPPSDHSLRTLALVQEEDHINDAREIACDLVGTWETLHTIGDCHSWEDAPKSFAQVMNGDMNCDNDHDHMFTTCWSCVERLYLTCRKHGLRYEDRAGRTLSSLQVTVV
ncbi:hypothetical protein M408DRAFT_26485 [Serendipita vermifera MAFF 305830]|uniref:F-box domain-containing protein n=1 Tax=Serendipita vermifera MAFF 305830 TaxID=933852 RepID=A0A0C3B0M5_SERVB|nr:hypothetical protein M408DRAFT_26485 [Serendipita vermifera MAFF 305830]